MNDQTHHSTHDAPPAAVVGPADEPHAEAASGSAPAVSTDAGPADMASERGEHPVEASTAPASSAAEPAAQVPAHEHVGGASPSVEASGHEASAAEEPPIEESAVEESAVEESAVEESAAEEPVAAIEEEEEVEDVIPLEEIKPSDEPPDLRWYILKVQSNREDSIREALQRRVALEGLERFFGDIIVPTEMVSEFKGGKKRIVKRKLYPGYLVVRMEINEETWFAVRETPGIGDFTGSAGKPTPMLPNEISRILAKQEEKSEEVQKVTFEFAKGDRVRIKEGTFENFEGEVDGIDEGSGRVTVMINIFGRSTPVELEHWQIEVL